MSGHKDLHRKSKIDFLLHIWLIFSSVPCHLQIKSKPNHPCITNIIGCRVRVHRKELLLIKAGANEKTTKLHLPQHDAGGIPRQERYCSRRKITRTVMYTGQITRHEDLFSRSRIPRKIPYSTEKISSRTTIVTMVAMKHS